MLSNVFFFFYITQIIATLSTFFFFNMSQQKVKSKLTGISSISAFVVREIKNVDFRGIHYNFRSTSHPPRGVFPVLHRQHCFRIRRPNTYYMAGAISFDSLHEQQQGESSNR